METERVEALLGAVQDGNLQRVAELLNEDPTLVDARNERGDSAILIASYRGKWAIQDLLRLRGAVLNVFEAAAVGDTSRVAELLQTDQDLPRAYAHDGFTALHLAAFFGHDEVVRLLLDRGADPNAESRNEMHVQPLHSAVARGHQGAVELLLQHGANANARQPGGWTPLHAAAAGGYDIIARLLLAYSAEPGATNNEGKSPSAIARQFGHEDIVHMLRVHGAKD